MKTIVITGPESTGKSALTQALAKHYQAPLVPEVARTFLQELDRPYKASDVLTIAKRQQTTEDELAQSASNLLFCDTDLRVCRIWMDFKYGEAAPWINQQIARQNRFFYLLCDIDLPWTYDPLREHPDQRKELFNIHQEDLQRDGCNFGLVSGKGEQRIQRAIELIEKQLYTPPL